MHTENIVESIQESISETLFDIKPRTCFDVPCLKSSALVAVYRNTVCVVQGTLAGMGEAERRRTLLAITNIEVRTFAEGKAEQEVKEEYIEKNFLESLEKIKNKITNTDNAKVSFPWSVELRTIKRETTNISTVSTPVKQTNFHIVIDKNLSPIKRPNTLKAFEDGNETNNDFDKAIEKEIKTATPSLPIPPNPTSSAPPTCSRPHTSPSFAPHTSPSFASPTSSSSAPPLSATPPTSLEAVEKEAGSGKGTKGNEPTHTDEGTSQEIRVSTAEDVNGDVELGDDIQEALKALEEEDNNDEVETDGNIQDTISKSKERITFTCVNGGDPDEEDQKNPNDDSIDALLDGDDDEHDYNLADNGENGEYEDNDFCVEDEISDAVPDIIEPDTNSEEVMNIHNEDDSAAKGTNLDLTLNPHNEKVTPEKFTCSVKFIPVKSALFVIDNVEHNGSRKRKRDEELVKEKVVKVASNSSKKGNPHKCDKCEARFTTKSNLKAHKASKHGRIKYTCSECNRTFIEKSSMTKHKQSKHEGKRFFCDQCDHKATTQGNLTTHKQSKHEGKRFDCDQCDHKATKQGNLTTHKQSKHEGKRFACDQCDYKATTQGHLTTHKQFKHESKRFVCDLCDHRATKQGNLTTHKQSKHEGKRFKCDQCDYEATAQSHLTTHKQSVHDGVTHTCGDCKDIFTRKSSLAEHKKAIHDGVMQKCDMCSYSTKHRKILWTHKQDEHGVYSKRAYPMYDMSNVKNRILYELSVRSLN